MLQCEKNWRFTEIVRYRQKQNVKQKNCCTI